jgi:hypothetical protein
MTQTIRMLPVLNWTLSIGLLACASTLPASAQTIRQVNVTVTDPHNRFVTGLDRDHFEVIESGVRRPITGFSDFNSPITIAVVGEITVQPIDALKGPSDVLVLTKSVADALKQLSASTTPRKGLIIATSLQTSPATIPEGIQVLRVEPSVVDRAVVELRSQYVLQVPGEGPVSNLEVVVMPPQGLPLLQPHWK